MRRLAYFLIPALVLGGLIVWRVFQNKREKALQVQAASARKNAPANVRVTTAVKRDIIHAFQGVGNVEAPFEVRVAPKTTGRLDYLQVREGAQVKRGEVLARMDPSQVQAALSQQQANIATAQANLVNAQGHYRRAAALLEKGYVAAQVVDDTRTQVQVAQGNLDAAKAQLRNIQSQLADLILRAPIDGFVTARFFDPGSVVTAGQPIVTVQDMRKVYITTSITEDLHSVHVGMSARADFDALPNHPFEGKVTQVNPAADPQSRQFLVRAIFDNAQNQIRPGMFCRITLVTEVTHDAVVVPHEAVKKDSKSGGQTVIVIGPDMKAQKRDVQTGDQDVAGVAITQGLQPGEMVVILSAQPPKDGQLVKIDKGAVEKPSEGNPVLEGAGGGGGISTGTPSSGGPNAPTYGSTPGGGASAPGSAGTSTGGQNSTTGPSSSDTGTGNGTSSSGGAAIPRTPTVPTPNLTPSSPSGGTSGRTGPGPIGPVPTPPSSSSNTSGSNSTLPGGSSRTPGASGTQTAPGRGAAPSIPSTSTGR